MDCYTKSEEEVREVRNIFTSWPDVLRRNQIANNWNTRKLDGSAPPNGRLFEIYKS